MSKFKVLNGNIFYRHWFRWYWLLSPNMGYRVKTCKPTKETEV